MSAETIHLDDRAKILIAPHVQRTHWPDRTLIAWYHGCMDDMHVSKTGEEQYRVQVGEHGFGVTLTPAYHQKLTGGNVTPEALIQKSFEFLLEREPASSILPEFDLPLIGTYFPEYEETMQKRVNKA